MEKTHVVICPDCNVQMVLRNSRYGFFYGCPNYPKCTVAHGMHPDGSPLGVPANKETRQARVAAHEVFDKLWKSGRMKRKDAYHWLRGKMNLDKESCHIGKFNLEQCAKVIEVCNAEEALNATPQKELPKETDPTDKPPWE